MRVTIVGAGPAGLYLAILLKLQDPAHQVRVLERNRHDDTFGFGVVFSDATMDEPGFQRLRDEFRAKVGWD